MPGMRRNKRHVVIALVLVATAACSDRTSPLTPTGVTVASPAQLADLTGTWTGSMSVQWDPIDGGGSCRQDAVASIRQVADRVSITIPAGAGTCNVSDYHLVGELQGAQLQVSLQLPSQLSPARAKVANDRLEIRWINVIWELRR